MSGRRWALFAAPIALIAAASGCRGGPSSRTVASTEPVLVGSHDAGAGTTVVDKSAPHEITFADRHPIISKPREYYDSSGDNPVVKAAAATVIGIPAGIFGELKQIVGGRPTDTVPRY